MGTRNVTGNGDRPQYVNRAAHAILTGVNNHYKVSAKNIGYGDLLTKSEPWGELQSFSFLWQKNIHTYVNKKSDTTNPTLQNEGGRSTTHRGQNTGGTPHP